MRRLASLIWLQPAISSIVRWQPSHHPVTGLILHTEMQGDGTGDCERSGTTGKRGEGIVRFSHAGRGRFGKG